MRIVVASAQVPFITGGAETLARGLLSALRGAGHAAELVTLPFRFFPTAEVERAMHVWEGENFAQLNLYEPDLVVCLTFPAYGLVHPRKVTWLMHQHRAAYEHSTGVTCPRAAASRFRRGCRHALRKRRGSTRRRSFIRRSNLRNCTAPTPCLTSSCPAGSRPASGRNC